MKYSPLLLVAALLTFGCQSPEKKEEKERAAEIRENTMADVSDDISFQSFVGRLRGAVRERDAHTIAPMMTSNFGYQLEPLGEGAGVFEYWDENNVWPELELILDESFKPLGQFMVAPPEFARNPMGYTGYRAGLIMVRGSWRFAYFVDG